ncbi:Putative short-chain dehydrogenase/reductase SDR, NAD(P)-binding domain superfamily [Septoria linicola]|uniref:Short-chain dehydrogenase/reductase SDR, NAD(P)-binding domain superfamily n=1 Tax=Septoria linicola TaxID=215465 RepID=A0A9Q9AIL8_9PEZI|nr:Putative short-chain dehydrogenase/reductase SDR, NAD(P)-binding domain superfamily [Septoria linicola]
MPTAVVTGANSGIGHAFANILISEGYEVHAADHEVGEKLQSLQCRLHRLDVRSPESIAGLAAQLVNKPVDLLLNIAGIMAPGEGNDELTTITKDTLTRIFETNTFGPLLLTQALLPNLLSASPGAKIGIVSSRVGSINDNSTGGNYAYRASKAAVNSIGKSMAVELAEKGIVVDLLHPGIVNSALNPTASQSAEAVEPEEAAMKLWAIVQEKGIEDTGKFWHREGHELPW